MGFVDVKDEMVFGKKLADVKEAAKSAIQKLGWKVTNESGSTIECRSGMSLMSMGSNITISLSNVGGKTKVEMHSKDKLGVVGSVGGNIQSKKNIGKLFNELSTRLANL